MTLAQQQRELIYCSRSQSRIRFPWSKRTLAAPWRHWHTSETSGYPQSPLHLHHQPYSSLWPNVWTISYLLRRSTRLCRCSEPFQCCNWLLAGKNPIDRCPDIQVGSTYHHRFTDLCYADGQETHGFGKSPKSALSTVLLSPSPKRAGLGSLYLCCHDR